MTSIALYDKSSVNLRKTFDKVAKNGTRVIKYIDMPSGATVTHAYKKDAIEPFKEIVQWISKKFNAPQHSGKDFTLNETTKFTGIREVGKQPISINTSIDEWFYMGKPTTTYTSGSKVQEGEPKISWIKNEFHNDPDYGTMFTLYKDEEKIHFIHNNVRYY